MTLLGIDLNASRVRAVRGPLGEYPCAIALESGQAELPLALLMQGKSPTVGGAALKQTRRLPHLVLRHFLGQIGGEAPRTRSGHSRGQKLTADDGLLILCKHLEACWSQGEGAVVAAPAYLTPAQLDRLMYLLDDARVPWVGSVSTPLAAALAAYAEQAWSGAAVLLDVDEHALTISVVSATEGQAQLLDTRSYPHLGLGIWKERLLNAVADGCIIESRWDPRADADAEQGLYDQLDAILSASMTGQLARLNLQTASRFHNLVLRPDEPTAICASLTRQVVDAVRGLFTGDLPGSSPGSILLSAAAARMPGLLAALQEGLAEWGPDASSRKPGRRDDEEEDFGEDLLADEEDGSPSLVVLSADATARGAHALAPSFTRRDLPRGHLEGAAPLPLPQPPEAGPPRLHFKGQVFFLSGVSFTMGRQQGCDLVFDGAVYPSVAPRHCEIVFDHRLYLLRDRSREGTFVNDLPATQPVALRPGDWIRLGPDGPVLRFLGRPDYLRLVTTA